MFFKEFTYQRKERDWTIVRWGRRCGRGLGNRDNRAEFPIEWNKTGGNGKVENVAEGRGNGGGDGFSEQRKELGQ